MQKLDVQFRVDDSKDVVSYTVDGDLKRPGAAIERAREAATADGYEEVKLEEVRLWEPAR